MGERKYLMADVAKKLDIPPYMLRYYEDALAINIPRNERGLRYYRKQELELFSSILNLRQKGFEISSIRMIMDDIHRVEKLPPDKLLELRDKLDTVMDRKSVQEDVEVLDGTDVQGVKKGVNSLVNEKSRPGRQLVPGGAAGKPRVSGSGGDVAENPDDKMQQFRNIMTGIVLDALKINNDELGQQIKYTVTDSVVKEVGYLISRREEEEEERFKSIDKMLREVCATAEKSKDRKKEREIKKGM